MKIELEKQIEIAVSILKNGGVVAFPTDTVYGLGANIMQENAIKKVFSIKKRNRSVPLPVLLSDITQLNQAISPVTKLADSIARHFWPGAITIVGYKSPQIPDIVTGGANTIAVRIPDHKIPLALINKLGYPITGTSANISGNKNVMTAREAQNQLGNTIDFIIDDGIGCSNNIASTIIDTTTKNPRIIREGAVPSEEIINFLHLNFEGDLNKCVSPWEMTIKDSS